MTDKNEQMADLLRRLAALSEPGDDDTEWLTCLAHDVSANGLANDVDPSATSEAAIATARMGRDIRALAAEAREILAK